MQPAVSFDNTRNGDTFGDTRGNLVRLFLMERRYVNWDSLPSEWLSDADEETLERVVRAWDAIHDGSPSCFRPAWPSYVELVRLYGAVQRNRARWLGVLAFDRLHALDERGTRRELRYLQRAARILRHLLTQEREAALVEVRSLERKARALRAALKLAP